MRARRRNKGDSKGPKGKRARGRPPSTEGRVRLVCKIPPPLMATLRRTLLERQLAGERPEDASRPLDLGDLVAEALERLLPVRRR